MRLTSLKAQRAGSTPRPRGGQRPGRPDRNPTLRAPGASSAGRRRGRLVALLGVAALSTVVGAWLLAGNLRQAAGPLESAATLSDISTVLRGGGWVAMDAHTMDQGGGFQMPAQMMPGAPAGNEMRLGIPITLRNTGGQAQRFNLAEEFFLVGGITTAPVALHSDTFGLLNRLNPGSAVDGVLYFDTTVPSATDPPLTLRWQRGGDTVDLAIPLEGSAPAQHPSHGP